jgi:hypothetical protein
VLQSGVKQFLSLLNPHMFKRCFLGIKRTKKEKKYKKCK